MENYEHIPWEKLDYFGYLKEEYQTKLPLIEEKSIIPFLHIELASGELLCSCGQRIFKDLVVLPHYSSASNSNIYEEDSDMITALAYSCHSCFKHYSIEEIQFAIDRGGY